MTNLIEYGELNQAVVEAIEEVMRAVGDTTRVEQWTWMEIANALATAASRLREQRRSVTTVISPTSGNELSERERGSLDDLRRELELPPGASLEGVLEAAIRYVSDAEQDLEHRWTEHERNVLEAVREAIGGMSEETRPGTVLTEAAGTIPLLRSQNDKLARRVAQLDDEVMSLREQADDALDQLDTGLVWTEPQLRALGWLRDELDLAEADHSTVEVLRRALDFIRDHRPIEVGQVIEGSRAFLLETGAVVLRTDEPNAVALTHVIPAGWTPAEPALAGQYLVLHLSESDRPESEDR